MQSRRPQDNLWYTVSLLILGFLKTLFQSIWYSILAIFGKTKSRLLEGNHFVRSLHFLFYEYPKSFWKKPTGIEMGRSIGTLVLYFLGKSKYFMDDSTKHPFSAKISKKGFTLLEMLLSITVFSVILILAFAAFGNISVSKQKILGDVDVYEQLYTALEQLSSTIKEGGDIDYEEYFNRRMLGTTLSG
jgi:prepilin-type N-terminal cleavage/methylation domain-containing protein